MLNKRANAVGQFGRVEQHAQQAGATVAMRVACEVGSQSNPWRARRAVKRTVMSDEAGTDESLQRRDLFWRLLEPITGAL